MLRMSGSPIAIEFGRAKVWRPTGETAFLDLNWMIREGETWAVVGPIGSGKSTLIEAIAGRMRVEGASWPFVDRLKTSGRRIDWPSEVIQRVSFKEESRLFSYSRHYYQQRFNFIEPNDDLTLDEFLHAGADINGAESHAVC